MDQLETSLDFNCGAVTLDLPINIDSEIYDEIDLSALSIQSSIMEVDNNGDPVIPFDELMSVPFSDWETGNLSDTYTAEFVVPTLTPDGCYIVQFELVDYQGNSYGVVGSYNFCVTEEEGITGFNNLPDFEGCNEGPGAVTEITITENVNCPSETCLFDVCFTPVDIGMDVCLGEYRLEIHDQVGNVISDFICACPQDNMATPNVDEGNLNGTCTCACTDEVCIEKVNFSNLTTPPFIGQVVSIYTPPGGTTSTTYSSRFEVEQPDVSEITVGNVFFTTVRDHKYNSCRTIFADLHFCINRPCMGLEIDVDNILINSNVTADVQVVEDDNFFDCYIATFKNISPVGTDLFCEGVDYTMDLYLDGLVVHSIEGSFVNDNCCEIEIEEDDPFEEEISKPKDIFVRGESIVFSIDIPNTNSVIAESETNDTPVFYVLNNQQTGEIYWAKPYRNGKLRIELPTTKRDEEALNNQFSLRLLAGEENYPLRIPDLNTPTDIDLGEDCITIHNTPDDKIHIKGVLGNYDIKVLDKTGQLQSVHTGTDETQVNIETLPLGLYFLEIKHRTEPKVQVKKILKQ